MSSRASLAADSSPFFHPFTNLPNEIQLHIFSFVLGWLITQTRGRAPKWQENYTKIRQLLDEDGFNPLLRTSKLIRSLTLTTWRSELLAWQRPKTERQENRKEKALCLIDLLGDEKLHLEGIRLLLTSDESWEKVKAQLPVLLQNGHIGANNAVSPKVSVLQRLSATSSQIELWMITYATHSCNAWQCNEYCTSLKMKASYFCPSLPDNDPLQGCNDSGHPLYYSTSFTKCRTADELEAVWRERVAESRTLNAVRGNENATRALEKGKIVLDLKWRREGWGYRAVRDEVRSAAVRYFRERLASWREGCQSVGPKMLAGPGEWPGVPSGNG